MISILHKSRHLNILFISIVVDIITSSLRNFESLFFLSGFDKFIFIGFFLSLLNSKRDQIIIIKAFRITFILTGILYLLTYLFASDYISFKSILLTPFRLLLITSAYYLGQATPMEDIYKLLKYYIPIFLITSAFMYGFYLIFSPKTYQILNPIAPSIAMLSSSSILIAVFSLILITYTAKRGVIIALILTFLVTYIPRAIKRLRSLQISKKVFISTLLFLGPLLAALFYIQSTEKYIGAIENINNLFLLEDFESIPSLFSNVFSGESDLLGDSIMLQLYQATGGRFTEIFEVHKALFDNNRNLLLFGAGSGWEVSYQHPQNLDDIISINSLHFNLFDIPFRIGVIFSTILGIKLIRLIVGYGRYISNLNYPRPKFKVYLITLFYIFLGLFSNVIIACPLLILFIGSIEADLRNNRSSKIISY